MDSQGNNGDKGDTISSRKLSLIVEALSNLNIMVNDRTVDYNELEYQAQIAAFCAENTMLEKSRLKMKRGIYLNTRIDEFDCDDETCQAEMLGKQLGSRKRHVLEETEFKENWSKLHSIREMENYGLPTKDHHHFSVAYTSLLKLIISKILNCKAENLLSGATFSQMLRETVLSINKLEFEAEVTCNVAPRDYMLKTLEFRSKIDLVLQKIHNLGAKLCSSAWNTTTEDMHQQLKNECDKLQTESKPFTEKQEQNLKKLCSDKIKELVKEFKKCRSDAVDEFFEKEWKAILKDYASIYGKLLPKKLYTTTPLTFRAQESIVYSELKETPSVTAQKVKEFFETLQQKWNSTRKNIPMKDDIVMQKLNTFSNALIELNDEAIKHNRLHKEKTLTAIYEKELKESYGDELDRCYLPKSMFEKEKSKADDKLSKNYKSAIIKQDYINDSDYEIVDNNVKKRQQNARQIKISEVTGKNNEKIPHLMSTRIVAGVLTSPLLFTSALFVPLGITLYFSGIQYISSYEFVERFASKCEFLTWRRN